MVIGAARNDAMSARLHCHSQGAGVTDDLRGVFFEFRAQAFGETHGLSCDYVHERTALSARKNRRIEGFGVLRFAENQSAARSSQSLMRGGGDEICVRNRRGMQA